MPIKLTIKDFDVIEKNILDYQIKPKNKKVKEIHFITTEDKNKLQGDDIYYMTNEDKLFAYYYQIKEYPTIVKIDWS